jgi:hypothetical protein
LGEGSTDPGHGVTEQAETIPCVLGGGQILLGERPAFLVLAPRCTELGQLTPGTGEGFLQVSAGFVESARHGDELLGVDPQSSARHWPHFPRHACSAAAARGR